MVCKQCNKNFEPIGREKICSSACRKIRVEESSQKYYAQNKEKVKERVRTHRQRGEYKVWQQQWNKKWREANREKVLEIRIKSQKKIYQTLKRVGFVTNEIREHIHDRDQFRCLCCGAKNNLTIDHIVPISKGGKTAPENLQTLCRSCNSSKQQKEIDYTKGMYKVKL